MFWLDYGVYVRVRHSVSVEENKNIFRILAESKYFEIKCKMSVHITGAVCIFEELDDYSGFIPLSNFRECDGKYRTPQNKECFY